MPTVGLNLRVTTDSRQGGRKYMEDVLNVKFQKGKDGKEIEFAYFAVFDGHGGAEAALFAKEHLLEQITKNRLFWSDDDTEVMKSIKEGFIATHRMMWKAIGSWPRTVSGLPSTAGSTASVVFVRNSKMYVAHVGDSSVVLGVKDKFTNDIKGHLITEDHKPESPEEKKRIESNGGSVIAKAGVQRVVWFRPKPQHKGPIRRSTAIDTIPFLAVARSLGDLWSYNSERDVFVVSPEPDVAVYDLDYKRHKCVILASDGLWNMMKPQDAVDMVLRVDEEHDVQGGPPRKPAVFLVQVALNRWASHNIRADNTSVICVMLDPPGASRTQLRHSSSTSSGSTVKISDSEDSVSESEFEIGESITLNDESAENNLDSSGLFVTPFTPLSECKTTENRFNFFKPGPRRPIYRGRPTTPRSAPAKLHTASFRHHRWALSRKKGAAASNIPTDRPSAGTSSSTRAQGLFESIISNSSVSFMEPESSSPTTRNQHSPAKHVAKDTSSTEVTINREPVSPSRTLRSQSPYKAGVNVTPAGKALSAHPDMHPIRPLSPGGNVTDLGFPKEATSAKSPLKVSTATKQGSPSAGLVSPIWPSSLEIEMGMEIGLEVEVEAALDIDNQPFTIETSDTCQNTLGVIPHKHEPCFTAHKTPEKRSIKRKCITASPIPTKRAKTPSPCKTAEDSQTEANQIALRTRARTPKKAS